MIVSGGGGIKSIQRGTTSVSSSVNVTISAVDMAKTKVNLLGYKWSTGSTPERNGVWANLTTTTNLNLYVSDGTSHVSWEVIEYA